MDRESGNPGDTPREGELTKLDAVLREGPILTNHSSAVIIDAYTDAVRRIDQDPEAEYEPEGIWREAITSFEIAVYTEAKEQPLQAAELFVHTLHAEDPNARLLTAQAVDALAVHAPHLALDIYRRLLTDEDRPVRARAAFFFLMESASDFSQRDMEAELKPVLQLVAESFPDDTATVWTSHRGSGHPRFASD